MILSENFKIQTKDIEKNNYIKNKAILEMFENIGTHHSDIVGYGPENMESTGVSWILLDWKVKVLNRPKYGEELYINTWARSKKRAYTYRDFEILNDDGTLCVIGSSKWALIDIHTGKIKRITDEVLESYKPEEKCVFENEELKKLDIVQNFDSEWEYKVCRRDIDFNGHMHNLYYLDLAYEVLPEEVYNEKVFDNIRIQYKSEIKLGDSVKCRYTCENDEHIVTIWDNEGDKVHAVIKLR